MIHRRRGIVALAAILAGGCARDSIESCAQNLSGEYTGERGVWVITETQDRLEIYPVFPDRGIPADGTLEIAPRVITLDRTADGTLRGEAKRRYMKASASCLAKVAVRITRCANDTLDVVMADTAPPLSFAPCQWGRVEPARVELWKRR